MSVYGLLRTSASGLAVQADRLGTVADNIANVSTVGYKNASEEFATFVLSSGASDYQSGSVEATTRYAVQQQAGFDSTTSRTDLAVSGKGFFVVQGTNGSPLLTRAGNFVKDGSGNLVNSAGYKLLGYASGATPVVNGYANLTPVTIGSLALQSNPTTAGNLFVNLPANAAGTRTSAAAITASLPSGAAVPTVAPASVPTTPGAFNATNSSGSTQIDTYDATGNKVTLTAYFTRTNVSAAPVIDTWQASIFNGSTSVGTQSFQTTAAGAYVVGSGAGTVTVPGGSTFAIDFTASSEQTTAGGALSATSAVTAATTNLPSANAAAATYTGKSSIVTYDDLGNQVTFDIYSAKKNTNQWEITAFNHADASATGGFPYANAAVATNTFSFNPTNGQFAAGSPNSLSLKIPGGNTIKLDLSQTTQLATGYTVVGSTIDGSAPSQVDHVEVSDSGVLSTVYQNGTRISSYTVPLATVTSPDNLQVITGNAYAPGSNSGNVQIGTAGSGGLGSIQSQALEKSTVDIASELTTMIEAQRNYQANSKVFSTGAQLLDVLVNLQV